MHCIEPGRQGLIEYYQAGRVINDGHRLHPIFSENGRGIREEEHTNASFLVSLSSLSRPFELGVAVQY